MPYTIKLQVLLQPQTHTNQQEVQKSKDPPMNGAHGNLNRLSVRRQFLQWVDRNAPGPYHAAASNSRCEWQCQQTWRGASTVRTSSSPPVHYPSNPLPTCQAWCESEASSDCSQSVPTLALAPAPAPAPALCLSLLPLRVSSESEPVYRLHANWQRGEPMPEVPVATSVAVQATATLAASTRRCSPHAPTTLRCKQRTRNQGVGWIWDLQ